MAAENPPYVIQADSHSAELFRRAYQTFLQNFGVVGPNDLAVSQNGSPNMSVNVAAGQCWVPGTYGTDFANQPGSQFSQYSQACYYGYNDAVVNLTIAAANASNPRYDLVCATVLDAQYSGSINSWELQVVTGTPAASPSYPTLPAASMPIAHVYVGANVTSISNSNITDIRNFMGVAPRGIPCGRVAANSTPQYTSSTVNTFTVVNCSQATFLANGMIQGGNGLQVPISGYYLVSGQVKADSVGSGTYIECAIMYEGVDFYSIGGCSYSPGTGLFPSATISDIIYLTAGQYVNLAVASSAASVQLQYDGVGQDNWLTAYLISC